MSRIRIPMDEAITLEEDPCKRSQTLPGNVHPREGIDEVCVDQRGIVAIRRTILRKVVGGRGLCEHSLTKTTDVHHGRGSSVD